MWWFFVVVVVVVFNSIQSLTQSKTNHHFQKLSMCEMYCFLCLFVCFKNDGDTTLVNHHHHHYWMASNHQLFWSSSDLWSTNETDRFFICCCCCCWQIRNTIWWQSENLIMFRFCLWIKWSEFFFLKMSPCGMCCCILVYLLLDIIQSLFDSGWLVLCSIILFLPFDFFCICVIATINHNFFCDSNKNKR